ncbi:MAG: peptidylprolyl isomerase [Nanoarchaeota archaeon]|nr:peptidylprolyl isomerase [Nanoarchaeota archaeon]MBU1031233.1 peptidylprolyl isomerase [Nanoarchaeota archaeon]MBU1849534.1 peptidylprolyl isomerase [Nanoarchaeota archaeon]
MVVKKGDKIKVEYTGTLEDGTVFDSTEKHGNPLEFEVGAGQLIKGFDEGVVGMAKDEEKEISIEPENAYGDYNPEMIKPIPKTQMPPGQEIKLGMILAMALPNGAQMPVKVTAVDDTNVTLDLNHPLAGKKLIFKVKVIEIN